MGGRPMPGNDSDDGMPGGRPMPGNNPATVIRDNSGMPGGPPMPGKMLPVLTEETHEEIAQNQHDNNRIIPDFHGMTEARRKHMEHLVTIQNRVHLKPVTAGDMTKALRKR